MRRRRFSVRLMRQNFIVFLVIANINIAVVKSAKAVAETVVRASMRVAAARTDIIIFVE